MTATLTASDARPRGASRLLYRFEARLTSYIPIGRAPGGVFVDVGFEGRVTEGPLTGASVKGVDRLLFRADGVGVMDVRKVIALGERRLATRVGGYVTPPPHVTLPGPEDLLSAEIAWPEEPFAIRGFELIETDDPELDALNREVVAVTGSVDNRAGTLVIEGHLHETPDVSLTNGGER